MVVEWLVHFKVIIIILLLLSISISVAQMQRLVNLIGTSGDNAELRDKLYVENSINVINMMSINFFGGALLQ